MTSLPSPSKRRLTYKVSLLRREDWSVACTTDGLDKALTEARSALATGRYQRVKVEQSFTDSSSNRAVATVIFDERGPAAPAATTGIGVRTLLTISVLLGIGMFFVTRFLIHTYSH
jgi:hypothetical protein